MAIDDTTPLLQSSVEIACTSETDEQLNRVNDGLSRAQILGLFSALSGVIIAYADTSIALSIHETVGSQFDSLAYSSWMITGFTIGYCVTLPMYGQLSDTYGRQRPLISAYCLFCFGCIISAIGQRYWQVVAGRIIAGCGGSGMISLVSIIIIDIAPPTEIAIWRSYVSVAAVIGLSLGGPIGGFLADTIGWRWSFLGQVPIATICCLATHWSLQSVPPVPDGESLIVTGIDAKEKPTLWKFDFPGASTLAISITSLLVIIDMKNKFSWGSPIMVTAATAGLSSTILFLLFESMGQRKPLIPLPLLKTEVGTFCLTQFLLMGGRFAFLSHVAPYFVRTQGSSDAAAGSYIAPSSVGNAIGALIAGRTLKRFGSFKKLSLLALSGGVLSCTLILLRWSHSINTFESFEVFLPGLFAGMLLSLQFIGLSLAAPRAHIATSISIYYMSQQVGIATGVSLTSSLMQNEFRKALEKTLVDVPNHQSMIKHLLIDSSYTSKLPEQLRSLVTQCYLDAFWVVPAVYVGTQIAILIPMLSNTDRSLYC